MVNFGAAMISDAEAKEAVTAGIDKLYTVLTSYQGVEHKKKILFFQEKILPCNPLLDIITKKMRLKGITYIFDNGASILNYITQDFEATQIQQMALIIIDYDMKGLNGLELIDKTHEFLKSHGVDEDSMPNFMFRDEQFWKLPEKIFTAIFKAGVKSINIIEEQTITKAKLKRNFRENNFYYRHLKDSKTK